MKKVIRSAIFIFCFIIPFGLFANTIIVKGYIKDSNNKVVANKTVKIYSDSSNLSCLISHSVITNLNGYYIDTLSCNGDIRKLKIVVENCNGTLLINEPQVSTTNTVESNFTLCISSEIPVTNCHAAFSYISAVTSASFSGIKFNSAGSEAPVGDSIISRTWIFGDSSVIVTGNLVDPNHAYAKAGIYTVCLTIKTKKGCESKFCSTVVFTPTSNNCEVKIQLTTEKISSKKIRFISNLSSTLLGDSLVQRTWIFGDGSSLSGNEMNPLKEYKDTGSYTVCVSVRTAKGCEKKYCINVVLKDSTVGTQPNFPACKAKFTFTKKDSTVSYNSESSKVISADDSIISRTWYYGDNSYAVSLSGNVINPIYKYSKPGSYKVYLVIKTKKGCESSFTETVLIEHKPIVTNCKAVFAILNQGLNVKFNSKESVTPSADSIINRIWSFGDSSLKLTDNRIDPSHQYTKAGNYTACLTIKTKSGCENKYCLTFTLRDSVPGISPGNCKALFQYSIKDSIITFNSGGSQAGSNDSIISRTWYYADNATTVTLTGNIITPTYTYSKPGIYKVYLTIKTKNGCESKYEGTINISPIPVPTNCKAQFTFTIENGNVKFKSTSSTAGSIADSIIGRTWIFGDSSSKVSGNIVDPTHTYFKGGTYDVYLLIKTKKGCESKYSAKVVIAPINCTLLTAFTSVRVSAKKIQFNSIQSSAKGDSIIQRNWKFGDNTILSGNEVSPIKEFPLQGSYKTCLRLKTMNGCEAELCKQVVVQDSTNLTETAVNYVKIISINPNPVVTRMIVTIWSRNNNVEAEVSVFDIYGLGKINNKKILMQGNNIIEVPTESLYHGPYFLKVSTKNGRDSKAFYKL